MSRDKHLTLTTMSTSRRMLPFSAVKFGIGRCRVLTADPEQGPKGVELLEALPRWEQVTYPGDGDER